MCGWYLCIRRESRYFKVVSDWLTLVADLCRTILVGGPLWTQFDVVVLAILSLLCFLVGLIQIGF